LLLLLWSQVLEAVVMGQQRFVTFCTEDLRQGSNPAEVTNKINTLANFTKGLSRRRYHIGYRRTDLDLCNHCAS
jgi:hypothetical protein